MIEIDQTEQGAAFNVTVHAGAKRDGIRGEHGGMLSVAVKQAPERGKANQAVVTLLATALGIKKTQLELLSGQTMRKKRFLVREVSVEELSLVLARVLRESGS